MNKRGQVLVAFVLILPIIFMLIGLIVDCGYLYIEKRNVDNNVKDVLKYGLKHIDEENIENKIKKQINLNIDQIDKLDVNINDEIIEIELKKSKKSIYLKIYTFYIYIVILIFN